VSDYVLGHELTHLVQEVAGLPTTERSCDILTMARAVAFCDEKPYYVSIPDSMITDNGFILDRYRGFIHQTAQLATAMRKKGKRNYIKWFEQALNPGVNGKDHYSYDLHSGMRKTVQSILIDYPVGYETDFGSI
jgi:hypothetical protein